MEGEIWIARNAKGGRPDGVCLLGGQARIWVEDKAALNTDFIEHRLDVDP